MHWNRPEVRRYLWDDAEVTIDSVTGTVARALAATTDCGGGLWLMSVADEFIGTCGLLPVFPELDSLLTETLDPTLTLLVGDSAMVEVLYSLEPVAWGSGYALEATRALLRFGHVELGMRIIFGGTDVANERSARTLRSAGMLEVTRFDGDVGPLVYFATTSGKGRGAPER